jgi:transcriptional regulator with GAF, ATPase, and Fis domain
LEESRQAGPAGIVTYDDLQHIERESILAALKQTEWKVSGHGGAAELLGIKPTTLASRMKKMGVKRPI